jgi:hypothetical protein
MIYTLFLIIYKYYIKDEQKNQNNKLLYENTDIEKDIEKYTDIEKGFSKN